MVTFERCPKCGKPCSQCRCKDSPCHLPLEEEIDGGEVEETEIPEEEKINGYKKREEPENE